MVNFTCDWNHAAKSEKNLYRGSWYKSLNSFGSQLSQNCPTGPKEDFFKISLELFISTYYALSCCNGWKKSLEQILRWRLALFWATIEPKFPIWPTEIFWKTSLKWFLSTYCALSCYEVWKKSLEWIMRYRFAHFWATVGPKLPIWLKNRVFARFHLNYFSFYDISIFLMIFISPIMLQSFKKTFSTNPDT